MYQTGGFWDDGNDSSKREHCYKVIPIEIAQDRREMTLHGFDRVYQTIGKLGYKFRDAGHNVKFVLISLNKKINPKHLKQLEDTLSIEEDSGTELAFV